MVQVIITTRSLCLEPPPLHIGTTSRYYLLYYYYVVGDSVGEIFSIVQYCEAANALPITRPKSAAQTHGTFCHVKN